MYYVCRHVHIVYKINFERHQSVGTKGLWVSKKSKGAWNGINSFPLTPQNSRLAERISELFLIICPSKFLFSFVSLYHKYLWSLLAKLVLSHIDILLFRIVMHSVIRGKQFALWYNLKFGRARPPLSSEFCKNFNSGLFPLHINVLTIVCHSCKVLKL